MNSPNFFYCAIRRLNFLVRSELCGVNSTVGQICNLVYTVMFQEKINSELIV